MIAHVPIRKIYLCGPINGCTDAECKDWREYAKTMIGAADCVDPMRRDFRGIEGDHTAEIVEGDKADIEECDALLVNRPKASEGTSMEVYIAWTLKKFIVVVHPVDQPISPWMRYHSNAIVHTMQEAIELLIKRRSGIVE